MNFYSNSQNRAIVRSLAWSNSRQKNYVRCTCAALMQCVNVCRYHICCVVFARLICIVYHVFDIGPYALPLVILRLHHKICVPCDPFLAIIWSILNHVLTNYYLIYDCYLMLAALVARISHCFVALSSLNSQKMLPNISLLRGIDV